jgi:predicted NUDIX family NTP pyrophosphohydrolase
MMKKTSAGILMGSSYVEIKDAKGKIIKFPEVDKAGFYFIEEARKKVFLSLNVFLDRLEEKIK